MKRLLLFLVFATSIIATVKSDQEWSIQLLDPHGFRVLAKNAIGIKGVFISGKIWNKPIQDYPNDEYKGELNLQSNGWWTYENLTAILNPGDLTIFGILADVEGHVKAEPDDMTLDEYLVPANTTRYPVSAYNY